MTIKDAQEQLFHILSLMEEGSSNATVECRLSNGDSVFFWYDTLHDALSFTGTKNWYEDSYACIQDFIKLVDTRSLSVAQIVFTK